MRLHRFYVNKPLGEEIVVENVDSGKELIHQWTNVFRYRDGSKVILFSHLTPGFDYTYQILSVGPSSVVLSPVSKEKNILPERTITLCMSLVKKDVFETVVRQATELGVSSIVPVLAGRSEKKNLNLKRLESIAKEAAEQCGRGDIPVISKVENYKEAFEMRIRERNIYASLFGTPASDHAFLPNEALNLWIGPEGGWTDEEENSAKSGGAELFKLADTVLKADTAAITLLSAIVSI